MIRTQIHFTEQQYSSPKAMARVQGISMAEQIRKSIDTMIDSSVKNNDRIARAMNAAGRFRSGLKDLSTNHDDYLREVFVDWRFSFDTSAFLAVLAADDFNHDKAKNIWLQTVFTFDGHFFGTGFWMSGHWYKKD